MGKTEKKGVKQDSESNNLTQSEWKNKTIEEIQYITKDVSRMPDCAEKIILHQLQKLLQSKCEGGVNIPNNEENESFHQSLEYQIRKQALNSQPVNQILVELKSKASILDTEIYLRRLLKEICPLNIQEIVRHLTKAAEGNTLIWGQDIVLFIGETGTGKSTTIQFLGGCEMGEKRVEVAKNVFIDKHIEAVSFPENNPWLKNVKSSCLNESETRYIKPVKVDLQQFLVLEKTEF